MCITARLAACLILLLLPIGVHAVSDFSLIDHDGKFHQLSRYSDQQAVVIYMHKPSCPVSSAGLSRFVNLRDSYRDQSVTFFVLVSEEGVSRHEMAAMMAAHEGDVPVLIDHSQLVTRALGFTRGAEAMVILPAELETIYHGALGEGGLGGRHTRGAEGTLYLQGVIDAVLAGRPVPADAPMSAGRPLELSLLDPWAQRDISYAEEVVPILERRCVECHREDGRAPWAMDAHRTVQGWSSMIRETLLTRRMPPGQIDPLYADRFVDLHHISDEEMATLIHWIEGGARNTGEEDPLGDLEPAQSEWALGEPDLVVEFPAQQIPATGVLDYRFVPVELGLSESRWVRAYEFNIDNQAALHHVIAFTQDARQQRQNASRGGSRTNFGGYAPGREYVQFDDDTGILLQRDMRFMIQFHYTTIGREVTDQTSIGLYFHDSPPARPLVRTAVMNGDFVIPPGARDHQVTATADITEDSFLHSFAPHMHFRGRSIRFLLRYPDGSHEELLSIPNFQHNWQMVYTLREPVFLPAGSTVIAEGSFDNSSMNPLNPDPSQEVRWGVQVWDEMFITWMRISEAADPQ